jgi:hypothetical protein
VEMLPLHHFLWPPLTTLGALSLTFPRHLRLPPLHYFPHTGFWPSKACDGHPCIWYQRVISDFLHWRPYNLRSLWISHFYRTHQTHPPRSLLRDLSTRLARSAMCILHFWPPTPSPPLFLFVVLGKELWAFCMLLDRAYFSRNT